jgi:predicted phosphoribosyltransferase
MGAVVDGSDPLVVRNDDVIALAGVGEDEFAAVRDAELMEIERRRRRYLGERRRAEIADRVAIIVDDGIATGTTVRAAIRGLRQRGPARLLLAVPVAPPETVAGLRGEVDELVCLAQPEIFGAIGRFYADFHQLSDDEVVRALAQSLA